MWKTNNAKLRSDKPKIQSDGYLSGGVVKLIHVTNILCIN